MKTNVVGEAKVKDIRGISKGYHSTAELIEVDDCICLFYYNKNYNIVCAASLHRNARASQEFNTRRQEDKNFRPSKVFVYLFV